MSGDPRIENTPRDQAPHLSMPTREPYQSSWFPQRFIDEQCTPKSLVAGIKLPGVQSSRICPEDIDHTITSELGALTRELANRYKASSFSTILTEQGHLFFGMPRNHAHPNCYGHSVECAAGIAVTSGHHSFPLVVTYDKDNNRPPFDGLVLERLAEHFVADCQRSMKLLHVSEVSETLYHHNQLLPFPHGGISRPHISARPLPAHKKYDFTLTADEVCGLRIPPAVLREMGRDLRATMYNSSADGETRPGRKRHAACVFTADGDVYFGVNLRSDVRAADRCAEWNALSAALIGGDKERLAGVMVYSPDYEEGSVCCCGRCLNSLGDFIDPAIGDMMIAYMGRTAIDDLKLYTEVKNSSYSQAEGRPLRRP